MADPDEMMGRLSSRTFTEWQEFLRIKNELQAEAYRKAQGQGG